ncbi:MAG TPA: MFS transporter [Aridibacter sp.]|nr:MFS transporter [Aridibacter sp.]
MDEIRLGLRENWRQFALLVVINGFVGGMVGLERSILPQMAETDFGVASRTAILSFITAFGLTKAITNYFTGKLAERVGTKNLLLIGWAMAIPVPLIIIVAESWTAVIFANLLLGISQGLTWTSTIMMKIDLVGERNRGLAMGLNEFAGYVAVGAVALVTGYLAAIYGNRPVPFYLGVGLAAAGFILTLLWVKDTRRHVRKEEETSRQERSENIFRATTWKDRTLGSVTQAGLVNNLNDGMMWGMIPILLLQLEFSSSETGLVAGVYPLIWGVGQLFTGKLADHAPRKWMLVGGMLLQGAAIVLLAASDGLAEFVVLAVFLGLGTALVYPTFLAVIADSTHPSQRSESLGTFRLWRDLGYPVGAVLSGVTADLLGILWSIVLVGCLTVFSALVILVRMPGSGER